MNYKPQSAPAKTVGKLGLGLIGGGIIGSLGASVLDALSTQSFFTEVTGYGVLTIGIAYLLDYGIKKSNLYNK